MSIEDQVDELIRTRPGRELMQPVYDDPARPVAEGVYRSGGCTAAYLLLTDRGRVIVNTGSTDGQTVEDYLVPAGATFTNDVQGTTPVNETMVKPEVRKALGEKHPAPMHHMKEKPATPPAP